MTTPAEALVTSWSTAEDDRRRRRWTRALVRRGVEPDRARLVAALTTTASRLRLDDATLAATLGLPPTWFPHEQLRPVTAEPYLEDDAPT